MPEVDQPILVNAPAPVTRLGRYLPPVELPAKIRDSQGYAFDRGDVTHWGVDLSAKPGTPVFAPEDLVVEYVAVNDSTPPLSGYGPGAILARGEDSGLWHVLGHLDAWDWSDARHDRLPYPGRKYAKGDEIGVVSKLNHVHWELRKTAKPPRGTARGRFTLDPIRWLYSDGDVQTGLPDPEEAKEEEGGGLGLVLLIVAGVLLFGGKGRK